MKESAAKHSTTLAISSCSVDLGSLDTLESHLDGLFHHMASCLSSSSSSEEKFDRTIWINCAGSLGHIGLTTDSRSLEDMEASVDLNVTSSLWCAVRFARFAKHHRVPAILVNISSLAALQPFPTMGIYSAGKAARDSYHTCMAIEVGDAVKVLNYAPGPLDNDMTDQLRESEGLDASLKPFFQDRSNLVDPYDSARALIELLLSNSFESGQHIDYFDLKPSVHDNRRSKDE
jgi:sepiapterin reductase